MIVYDKEQKQIVIPNGLGNVNIIINGGECPDCPELTEISITENGRYEGAYNVVNVDVPTEGGDKPTPPQDGWGMTGVFNDWGGTPDVPFEENGEWEGRPYKVIRNFEATGGEFKIRRNNDVTWTDVYTANFYDIPQFALLRKDDWNMSIDDGVWDIYLFFGNDGVPNEMLILHTGTDLSTIKYEYTLTISTDKENAIIAIVDGYTNVWDGYSDIYDRYCGGSATVTMKLGNSYNTFIYMEGYEDIYEELACRNDEERTYTLTKIEGGGDCPEGGCTLTSRTFTSNGVYHPEPEQMQTIWFTAEKPSAYDTGIKLVDDSWVEIYFRATEGGDTPTLIGCEDSDWSNTTFATRWYDNNLGVKIGGDEISVPYTAGDDKLHKLKFGKNVGVWFDDAKVSDTYGGEWILTDHTIYIGAMNDPSNNNEKGFWRPWVGYIGDVTIYGNLNGNVAEYHFKAGDYGRGGEFKRVEDNTNLPNLGGDGMAIAQAQQYGEAPDGFSEVTVNVPQYNLGTLDWTLTSPSTEVKNASDDGYNGYSTVTIRPENIITEAKESAKNDFKNKMKEITITENGTYSIEDQINVESLKYNGGYHTDTISTYDINRIEVTFKADTSESISGGTYPFILGGSLWGLSELPENREGNSCARAIQYAYGRIVGYWEGKHTGALGTMDGEWLTIVLDENGMTVKYPTYEEHSDYTYDNGKANGGGDIFPFIIGGQGSRSGGADESSNFTSNLIAGTQFRGLIKEIKINTNSMGAITYIPKNLGVWDRKVENTGEFLSALEPTEGEVTMNNEQEKKYPYGFKRVEVNVVPQISKIDIAGTGVKFGYSTFEQVPEWIDFSNVTDMVQMFRNCEKLITIPQLDTSNVTNMANMFAYCHNLTTIPLIDTSKVTDMSAMFFVCNNLTSIPQLDTSKVTNMYNMFFGCRNLTTVPQLDTSKVTDMSAMFEGCVLLTTIPKLDFSNVTNTENMFANCNDLTNLGGFINLKYSINLSASYKLTRESVLNIFNNMAEVTDNQTIYLNSAVYSHLTEEDISIATQKGWNVQEGAQPS